jgi:hypothetical protein
VLQGAEVVPARRRPELVLLRRELLPCPLLNLVQPEAAKVANECCCGVRSENASHFE